MQPREIAELVAPIRAPTIDDRDHAEGTDRRDAVGGGVVEQRRDARAHPARPNRDDAEEEIARVRDGRIGEEPADVGLREGADISNEHRRE